MTSRRSVVAALGAIGLGGLVSPALSLSRDVREGSLDARLSTLIGRPTTTEEFHSGVMRRVRPGHAQRAKAKLWRDLYPNAAVAMLNTAADDVNGRMILPGTGNKLYFIGTPPDWRADPVGDAEYIAFINRMYSWPRLLRAWSLTGEDRFAERVVLELDDWISSCPPLPPGTDLATHRAMGPWRLLEAGLRMDGSWPDVLTHLAGTRFLGPERLARFALSVQEHLSVLAEIPKAVWPNADHNMYLADMSGLLSGAVMFPEFAASRGWVAQAMREIERCLYAQLSPDGGHVEGSPHYHNICTATFARTVIEAKNVGLSFPADFENRLVKALDYTAFSTRPTGRAVPWADGDAEFTALRTALLGALATDKWDAAATMRGLPPPERVEEMASAVFWAAPDAASWQAALSRPREKMTRTMHVDRGLDQAMMRTGWSGDAISLFFGCHTPIFNSHAHADPASFDLTAFGRTLVADPGRFTYREGADRRAFKSAKWHNSVTIDDHEPFEYISSWQFGPQREGRLTRAQAGDIPAAEAINRNFAPCDHRRVVALLGDALLIVDEFDGLAPGASVQSWFHLDSTRAIWDPRRRVVATADAGMANVMLMPSAGFDVTLHEGRISDGLDIARASTRVRMSIVPAQTRVAYATLVVPMRALPGERDGASNVSLGGRARDWDISFDLDGRSRRFVWTADGPTVISRQHPDAA